MNAISVTGITRPSDIPHAGEFDFCIIDSLNSTFVQQFKIQ